MRTKHILSYAKGRYNTQKSGARARGIPFLLTFEEWYQWFLYQGVDRNVPQGNAGTSKAMCRKNDQGPYELSNIYLGTQSSNVSDANKRRWTMQKIDGTKGLKSYKELEKE